LLMRPRRRRRHEQLAVDDLVPVAVVWQIFEIVERPLPFEHGHGHRINSSAPSEQVSTAAAYPARARPSSSHGFPRHQLAAAALRKHLLRAQYACRQRVDVSFRIIDIE